MQGLLVGQIDLIFRPHAGFRRLGSATLRLFTRLFCFLLAIGHFLIIFGPLASMALLGTLLDLDFCLCYRFQSIAPAKEFLGDIKMLGLIANVGRFGPAHQFFDFPFQALFETNRIRVAERRVLGGIGFDLRAIQTHVSKCEQTHLGRKDQYLGKKRLQFAEKPATKMGDRVVIWLLIGRDIAKSDGVPGGFFEPTRRERACRIPIEEKRDQHRGMVSGRAAAPVGRLDPG